MKSFHTKIGKNVLYQLSRSGALGYYRILGYRNWNLHYWNMGKTATESNDMVFELNHRRLTRFMESFFQQQKCRLSSSTFIAFEFRFLFPDKEER